MQQFFPRILRFSVGMIFLISALAKFFSLPGFAQALASFELVPSSLQLLLTYLIPAVEFVLAFSLFIGFATATVSIICAILLAIFLSAGATETLSGATISNCGCFGELYRSGLGVGFFLRNLALLMLTLLLFWMSHRAAESNTTNQKDFDIAKREMT